MHRDLTPSLQSRWKMGEFGPTSNSFKAWILFLPMQQALLLTLCSLALWSLRNRDVGWEWWSHLSWVLAGSMSTLPYPTFSQENLFTLRHVFWQPSQDFPLQVYMSESCGNIKKKTAMSQTSSQICKLLEASLKGLWLNRWFWWITTAGITVLAPLKSCTSVFFFFSSFSPPKDTAFSPS